MGSACPGCFRADLASCNVAKQVGDKATYLERGPGLIFLYHPALGPLWDVVAQKIRGGSLADRSEMVLEVGSAFAELDKANCLCDYHVRQVMHHWGLLLWDTAAALESHLVALQLGIGKPHRGED
jgi:hypothetical protein